MVMVRERWLNELKLVLNEDQLQWWWRPQIIKVGSEKMASEQMIECYVKMMKCDD